MEDNEENQNLALQILAMVDEGCMLQLAEGALIAVGYAELWLDRDMMFYIELGDLSTGHQHVLRFDSFKVRSNQVIFYDAQGKIVAGLAPYVENPEVNTDEMNEAWAQWQQARNRWLPDAAKQAREWRHAQLG